MYKYFTSQEWVYKTILKHVFLKKWQWGEKILKNMNPSQKSELERIEIESRTHQHYARFIISTDLVCKHKHTNTFAHLQELEAV